ncbi:hypothetical protein LIER_15263 [Lithospermum erythrorhizon]|uniref:Uncharacterized protein n=1 Tax=Lithospermum erythrorhizon TaxID=34254 RepID=A0AAV3Q274_LITER
MGASSSSKKIYHPFFKAEGSVNKNKKPSISIDGFEASSESGTAASPISINTLGWNCRGLGHPRAVRALQHFVKTHKPNIIFLMKTRLWKQEWEDIKYKLKMPNAFLVQARGRKGDLDLLWPREMNITILSF